MFITIVSFWRQIQILGKKRYNIDATFAAIFDPFRDIHFIFVAFESHRQIEGAHGRRSGRDMDVVGRRSANGEPKLESTDKRQQKESHLMIGEISTLKRFQKCIMLKSMKMCN